MYLEGIGSSGGGLPERPKSTRIGAFFDRKLADTKLPLFGVVDWYGKAVAAAWGLDLQDVSINEEAAIWFGASDFESESEIGTRLCRCMSVSETPDPNVCKCWEKLKAARSALTHTPAGVETACDETPPENPLLEDPRYLTLLYEAFAAHPRYAYREPASTIRRWQELGIAAVESTYLIDWFLKSRCLSRIDESLSPDFQEIQNLQKRQGSRLAAELNARLAGAEPLLDIVAWWQGERREAVLNGEKISAADMNDAEGAVFGIGLIDELRGIGKSSGVPEAATAYESELQGYWAELEKTRKKA
jgi:hypothetical protein